jgi:hypothetical protein
MENEEEIEILYNNCYGGWNISKKAIELYKLRNNNVQDSDNTLDSELDFYYQRNDPILIQIYKELGHEFDDKYSKTKLKKINKKYENYFYIDEYDGAECVKINYTKYKLDNLYNRMKEILQSNDNNQTKINEIEQFISSFEL